MLYLCRTLRILVIGLWDLLFSLFQLLPVDQAWTRQWHLHLRIQWCHSQVRMARFICMTFFISLSLMKHWNIDISLTLTFALFSYRFIAERGEGGQLIHVEKIDDAYHLKPLTGAATENVRSVPSSDPERPLSLLSGKPRYSVFHGQTLDFNILYETQNYPLL